MRIIKQRSFIEGKIWKIIKGRCKILNKMKIPMARTFDLDLNMKGNQLKILGNVNTSSKISSIFFLISILLKPDAMVNTY